MRRNCLKKYINLHYFQIPYKYDKIHSHSSVFTRKCRAQEPELSIICTAQI